ncbi:NAD(P)/FAD-dependent oxidoreductase [Umezawaea tangerina]|uniref:Glycine/D-amino acid oxidase-like deaminating enzyme n=1 Tax=Umezawaea tangerina TaxID=84725 RepID=A0A2T0SWJ6_9PSEU|nr:FAD-dependent oxidoreductase [Umezawaea tangerina]PRY37787.1 glycine/D-amino acid oxidase-like deaminating enzyme [Umezawaea tangerina]
MRIAVVGGGVAGSLLAWRLREQSPDVLVDVLVGDPSTPDASGASGGLVRAFETAPDACRIAAESLAEVRGSPMLREWTGYREVGAVYLLPEGVDPSASLREVDDVLPGSARVGTAARLAEDFGFRGLAPDAIGVVERCAGYISPALLRAHALVWLAHNGCEVRRTVVSEVTPEGGLRLADGTEHEYDVVVVAAGAWTPALVPHGRTLRTKQIQYGVYRMRVPGLGAFVDEPTGLYGRPHGEGTFLLGLGCDRWDVDPAAVRPDAALADRVVSSARARFGVDVRHSSPREVVASFDCYREPSGLALLPIPGSSSVFTFTGGSGGAAKTVVGVSRHAARMLVRGLAGVAG